MSDERTPGTPLPPDSLTPPLPPAPKPRPAPAPNDDVRITTREKSPALAMILAFVPFGLGHLYLGLYYRAMLFFVAFWFSIYLELPLIAVFFYFFTIFDAFRQAQLMVYSELVPDPPQRQAKGGLGLGVFLVVVGGVLLLRNWIDLDEIRYFLQDYSPAILVAVGVYLIFAAVKERNADTSNTAPVDEDEPGY